MKKNYFSIIVFTAAILIIALGYQPSAIAQVPAGVKVDSIGPAPSWRNQDPFRSHHLVSSPNGKMVFVTGTGTAVNDNNGPSNPAWYYSTDNGTTWSVNNSPFVNNSDVTALAIAADNNFAIYCAFNRGDSLFFNKDIIGDGTGLLADVMLNAAGNTARCADIAVSPDGSHVIITAQPTHGDYDSLFAYVSSDGGNTFTKVLALTTDDPSLSPPAPAYTGRTFQWDITSLSMGTNGYAFVDVHANYDSTFHWNLISQTTDYGMTWKASWVGLPDTSKYTPTGNAWDYNGSVLAINNVPHLASLVLDKNGIQTLIESHMENGVWVYHTISHPDTARSLSYEEPRDGGLGVDSQGRLYCVWTDQNLSVSNDYELFVSGSSDGGDTWTKPVRLTGAQPYCVGTHINSPQLSQFVSDPGVAIVINGDAYGLFGGGNPTAWVEAQFPLSAVWNGPFDKDTVQRAMHPSGYAISTKASVYGWIDASSGNEVDTLFRDTGKGPGSDKDDGFAGPFPIGFNFTFMGRTETSFYMAVEGAASFNDSTAMDTYSPLPNILSKTILAIATPPYPNYQWDWDMSNQGKAYYWTNAAKDTCVMEWYQDGVYGITSTDTCGTFEIILSGTDSTVTYEYQHMVLPSPATALVRGDLGKGFDLTKMGFVPASGTGVRIYPTNVTGVLKETHPPEEFSLSQNYPNPFNPTTQIKYTIPKSSFVTLKVYNILGEVVSTLYSGNRMAGNYTTTFDAGKFASGIYFYRLKAGNFISVKKMVLLK